MTCTKCGRSGNRGFAGDVCKATTACEKRAASAPVATFVDVELPFGTSDEPTYEPMFGTALAPVLVVAFGVAAPPVFDGVRCPTGGWWAHDIHPADGHDAVTDTRLCAMCADGVVDHEDTSLCGRCC